MKKFLRSFFTFALLLCFAQCLWADVSIDSTNFPDKSFREEIEQIEKSDPSCNGDGILDTNEIANIKELILENKGIDSLKGIEHFTSLVTLDCSLNNLTELDLHYNTELVALSCSLNMLRKLVVSNNKKLVTLLCDVNQLTELDISNNKDLVTLSCSSNQLTSLDVSSHSNLQILECGINNLKKLDLSLNKNLYMLHCDHNALTTLDLGDNEVLGDQNLGIELGINPSIDPLYVNNQIMPVLEIIPQSDDTLYPYALNFGSYMASEQLKNIVPSSVRGITENKSEIETVYENGIAKFQISPATVEYSYVTGFKNLSMDVKIGSQNDFILSINNHVYRLFPRLTSYVNAKDFCESLGGHLITINSDEEKKLVEEFLKLTPVLDRNLNDIIWVGGERTNDKWHWVKDDEEFNVTVGTFDTEVPEDYLLLVKDNTSSFFWGVDNSFFASFICEWEPVIVADNYFAPHSAEYDSYRENPEAYKEASKYGLLPDPIVYPS